VRKDGKKLGSQQQPAAALTKLHITDISYGYREV
jgi:hypothetical protein